MNMLAAEKSGVDTISLCLPRCHEEVAKNSSLNVFVHPFTGDELTKKDVKSILELLATIDCAVLGSGIAREKEHVDVLMEIISECSCPMVLDATALQPETLEVISGKTSVLTPHMAELERMGLHLEDLPALAKKTGAVFCVKGETDHVIGPEGHQDVSGGNAGLTVGGTGDALAGLIAGLIAQGTEPFEAAVMGTRIIKRAGTLLYPNNGYAYGTRAVIEQIPHLIHTYSS